MTFTHEQIRRAIFRAADSIERDYSRWQFSNCYVESCGTPMCAAGWIGFHLGFAPVTDVNKVCQAMPSCESGYCAFDDQMRSIDTRWFDTPANAVAALRAYADKYFPATNSTTIRQPVVSWSDCAWKPSRIAS
jgi:hypothetical protein